MLPSAALQDPTSVTERFMAMLLPKGQMDSPQPATT